jgi:hypothetical protein
MILIVSNLHRRSQIQIFEDSRDLAQGLHAIQSPYCQHELDYALSLHKRIIPVRVEAIDPSALHPELAKVQWLDFNQREGDFSANFTDLLRLLDTDKEHLHAHTRLLMRAIAFPDREVLQLWEERRD